MNGFYAVGLRFVGALALAALTAPSASALDLKPDDIRGKSSKEPTSVLQSRYFLKAFRPEFGLLAGQILDEAYLKTTTTGARAGMFVSEWIGFEVAMLRTTVKDSSDRRALNTLKYRPLKDSSGNTVPAGSTGDETVVSPDPEVNAIHAFTDTSIVAAPFYGKLNLLNKFIVYTDLYVSAGYSRVTTDQGALNAGNFGAGERFYVGQALSFRLDFKDRIYTETRAGEPSRKNCYSWDLGASYFFN